jgi:uncharacterized membrane protein
LKLAQFLVLFLMFRINNNLLYIRTMSLTDLLVLAVIILALDLVFLYLAKDFFARQVMLVQGTNMKVYIPSAAICYILIVVGLYYFVLRHIIVPNATSAAAAIQTMRLEDGVRSAFFLGILVYGVYETTTLAILRNWSPVTALVDTTWGGTLFALSAYLFYKYKTLVF